MASELPRTCSTGGRRGIASLSLLICIGVALSLTVAIILEFRRVVRVDGTVVISNMTPANATVVLPLDQGGRVQLAPGQALAAQVRLGELDGGVSDFDLVLLSPEFGTVTVESLALFTRPEVQIRPACVVLMRRAGPKAANGRSLREDISAIEIPWQNARSTDWSSEGQ